MRCDQRHKAGNDECELEARLRKMHPQEILERTVHVFPNDDDDEEGLGEGRTDRIHNTVLLFLQLR